MAGGFTHLDPSGTSEPGAAYDPLGNRVVPQNPPQPQSPPFTASPMYGPGWFGSGSSFSNANNYSTGCMLDGAPATCSSVMQSSSVHIDSITTSHGWNAIIDVFGGVPVPTYTIGVVHYWRYQPVDSNRVRWIPRYGRIWNLDLRSSGTGQQDRVDYPTRGRTPGPPPRNPSPLPDDCHKLADIVERLGKRYKNDLRGFYDALYDRFNNQERPDFNYNEFRSTGFKDQFRDETPSTPGGNDISPNQVYHYIGGFRAGWWLGETLGRAVTHDHETEYELRPEGDVNILPDTPNHRADKALFDVAVRHGAEIGFWGRKNPSQLADMIRKDVCK